MPPVAPQPPSPDTGTIVRTRPVMFGEPYTDVNGEQQLAARSGTFTELMNPTTNEPVASMFLTVEQTMVLANGLASSAGHVLNMEVGDDGKSLPITERLRRLHTPRLPKPER